MLYNERKQNPSHYKMLIHIVKGEMKLVSEPICLSDIMQYPQKQLKLTQKPDIVLTLHCEGVISVILTVTEMKL